MTWDRVGGTLVARQGAKRLAISSGGTIPDRGLYGVFLDGAEGPVIESEVGFEVDGIHCIRVGWDGLFEVVGVGCRVEG